MGIRIGSLVRVDDNHWNQPGKVGVVDDDCCGPDDDLVCFFVNLDGVSHHFMAGDVTLVGRADLEKRLAGLKAETEVLQAALVNMPPFEKGQEVRVLLGTARGRKVTVLACEKAFGQWMAQVGFPGNAEPYTYPCDKLEAA